VKWEHESVYGSALQVKWERESVYGSALQVKWERESVYGSLDDPLQAKKALQVR
jgi:hypothetical protein